jgi:hypothetical protein
LRNASAFSAVNPLVFSRSAISKGPAGHRIGLDSVLRAISCASHLFRRRRRLFLRRRRCNGIDLMFSWQRTILSPFFRWQPIKSTNRINFQPPSSRRGGAWNPAIAA